MTSLMHSPSSVNDMQVMTELFATLYLVSVRVLLSVVIKMGVPLLDSAVVLQQIQKFEVDALTIRQMLQLHSISDVLVVLIDTEGFDWEVVKQLPLHHSGFQPVSICRQILVRSLHYIDRH